MDGTLGSFGGGYVLLRQALGEIWGQEPTAEELQSCSGSTDWEIVDELHRRRFGTPLASSTYAAYDSACLARFEATFHPEGRQAVVHQGLVTGMTRLLEAGHRVWLVSGNTPKVLDFKARLLGVDPRIARLGSLPNLDRVGLIRRALEGCAGPHLYVGDRPHDRDAAKKAGVPFLGVGDAVPGSHPILNPEAEADHLLEAIARIQG
ncbi:MAG: haloacid dehalogenase-like hydrolase [Holophaga sp.]|nr:haloacid dehalogenase-like hydrolase [Holophaga sp.]